MRFWYAVMTDLEDTDWGTGSFNKDEAIEMARSNKDIYPDGYIAVIDVSTNNPVCTDEIHDI